MQLIRSHYDVLRQGKFDGAITIRLRAFVLFRIASEIPTNNVTNIVTGR